mgnify:CR=1|jgi:hypothetical protein
MDVCGRGGNLIAYIILANHARNVLKIESSGRYAKINILRRKEWQSAVNKQRICVYVEIVQL